MENETASLWSKKQTELTVGDAVKVTVGVTVLTTAAAFVTIAAFTAAARLTEKLAERKAAKLDAKNQKG